MLWNMTQQQLYILIGLVALVVVLVVVYRKYRFINIPPAGYPYRPYLIPGGLQDASLASENPPGPYVPNPPSTKPFSPACKTLMATVTSWENGVPLPLAGSQWWNECIGGVYHKEEIEEDKIDPNTGESMFQYPTITVRPEVYKACKMLEGRTDCILNCEQFERPAPPADPY